MKFIKLSILMILFFIQNFSLNAQNSNPQILKDTIKTTMEEFLYLTKGLKIQQESSLDMKKGYVLKQVGEFGKYIKKVNRSAKFSFLFRDGDKFPCATLMELRRLDTGYKEYFCIPNISSSEIIWEKSYKDFMQKNKNWEDTGKDYSWSMIKMISFLSSTEIE